MQNNPNNRTPTLEQSKVHKGLNRKLSQGPSQVHHLNSDDGGEDDQQPMKPVINYDDGMPINPDEMPMLANKHRQQTKKNTIGMVKDNN
jgi:hypothetical protein